MQPDYFLSNSVFQYCHQVNFKKIIKPRLFRPSRQHLVAADPASWFHYLQRGGCTGLKLFYQPSATKSARKDYQTAGFIGGGGIWAIEALHRNHADYWSDHWEVTQKDDPQDRIWSVSYGNTFTGPRIVANNPGLRTARCNLETALHDIIQFSQHKGFGSWIPLFQNSLDLLSSKDPQKDRYYGDCLAENWHSLESRQLLFAAMAAWVFGGMGTWNDIYIVDSETNELYDQVSTNLYSAINQAFLAAINSTEEN